jgi:hypothetical protein
VKLWKGLNIKLVVNNMCFVDFLVAEYEIQVYDFKSPALSMTSKW